jgi:hypothetical protein
MVDWNGADAPWRGTPPLRVRVRCVCARAFHWVSATDVAHWPSRPDSFPLQVGNFLAYGMAPASVVSPLGAVSVVRSHAYARSCAQKNTMRAHTPLVRACLLTDTASPTATASPASAVVAVHGRSHASRYVLTELGYVLSGMVSAADRWSSGPRQRQAGFFLGFERGHRDQDAR